jgi:hypothetical protein
MSKHTYHFEWAQHENAPQLCRGHWHPRHPATLHHSCHLVRGVGIGAAELLNLLPGYRGPRPLALGNAPCDLVDRSPGQMIFVEKTLDRHIVCNEEWVEGGAELGPAGLGGLARRVRGCMKTFRRLRYGTRRRGRRAQAWVVVHIGRSFGRDGARRWRFCGSGSGTETDAYRLCISMEISGDRPLEKDLRSSTDRPYQRQDRTRR